MSFMVNIMPLAELGAVLAAGVASLVSLTVARRDAKAKRRLLEIAKSDPAVVRELRKAYRDRSLDAAEIKIIVRSINKAIDASDKAKKSSSSLLAKRFITDLHPEKSRRLFEDLAKKA